MKRILGLFSVALLLFLVSACSEKFDVAITIENMEPARTSVYLELDVQDPYNNIVDKSIYVVVYEGKTEVNRKTATKTDDVTSVEFTGLAVGKTYNLSVFATYDKKTHVMTKSSFTTSEVGGSETNPKLISTTEDFYQMKLDPNAYYRLENDLDFNNESFNNIFFSTTFTGSFDGNNKEIKNVKLDQVNTYLGIFGYNKGNIKDLTVRNVEMVVEKSTQYIGILAGRNTGIIENVNIVDSSISLNYSRTGQIYVGGMVGLLENPSSVKNSSVSNVTIELAMTGRSEPFVGLLAGRMQAGQLNDVSATGEIKSLTKDISYYGGLVGVVENVGNVVARITNAKSDVSMNLSLDVTSTLSTDALMALYAGGLVGGNFGGNIQSVYSNGTIDVEKASNTASYNKDNDRLVIGGLIGFSNGTINEALASVDLILGRSEEVSFLSIEQLFVGGLVGQQVGDKTTNSLALEATINVNLDNTMSAFLSSVVGNDFENTNAFKDVVITYDGIPYTAVTVVRTTTDDIDSVDLVALETSVSDYFTSAYIKAILEQSV